MSQSIFHRNPKLTLTVVTGVMCLGLLLAVEAFLTWTKPEPARASHRAVRLREHPPGLDQQIAMPDELLRDPDSLAEATVHLGIDRDGFIEPSQVHEKPELVIAFLGGSTTECLWVQEENRFPYVVGRLIEQRTALSRVNSLNVGRSANHSMHSFTALVGKVLPKQPAVCVLMHNCNDLMVLLQRETYWTTQIASRDMLERRRARHTVGSRCKDLVRQIFPNVLELFSPPPTDDLAALRGRTAKVDREFIERHFRSSLGSFIDLCRRYAIQPVLMTQANRITNPMDPQFDHLPERLKIDFGVEYEAYHEIYHWMNELIRTVGAEEKVPVVDLAAEIPQTAEFVYDPYHLNDAGSRRAAELIVDALLAAGVLR